MNHVTKMTLAAAAAVMFSGAIAPVAFADEAQVHCMGINSCKGQSKCSTAENACAGQNSCKGKGWLPTSAKECAEKGGTVAK